MTIEPFDSLDEIFERMQRNQKAADTSVRDWQAAIKPGDYIVRQSELGFPIYSEILEEPGDRPTHLEHYRFTRSYSVSCPEGELGDIHVSTVRGMLSPEEFEYARARRWGT